MVREAADKTSSNNKARFFRGQRFGQVRRQLLNRKKNSIVLLKKPKLDNARKLRGIHFIDLDDMEFKDTMNKTRAKSWSRLWIQQMSCKVPTWVTEKLVATTNLILADQITHAPFTILNK